MSVRYWLASALLLLTSGCGKSLEGQIQEQVRTLDNASLKKDQVEILSIQATRDKAIAEISVKTAVKMRKEGDHWVLDEVSLGGGRWEKVDSIVRALNQDRGDATRRQLESVKDGVNRYRDREGALPPVTNFVALIDLLAPRDLKTIIRVDRWGNPYVYRTLEADRFELRSLGPDAVVDTDDDLVVEG